MKETVLGVLTALTTLEASAASVEEIFQKPLITGASVSADYGTLSPGKRLAMRYTTRENIRTIASGGTPGKETVRNISEAVLKDRTSIIAVDLFFWDSTSHTTAESLKALERIISLAKQHALPLVLGEIPELLPGRQPTRSILNEAIRAACISYESCVVMPFDQLHQKLQKDGYLEIGGKKMTVREIVPDGLHLSKPAADFLADKLLSLFPKS